MVSTSATQDERTPHWAYGYGIVPEETAKDRLSSYEALKKFLDLFDTLRDPSREQDKDPLTTKLVSIFDLTTSLAVRHLASPLLRLLFESPVKHVSGPAKQEQINYLVMWIDDASIREFGDHLEYFLNCASDADKCPTKKDLINFLIAWTSRMRGRVSMNTFDPNMDPKLSQAMRAWSDELQIAANDFSQALAAGTAVEIADEAAAVAIRASKLAEEAAGLGGAATLSAHFKGLADKDGKSATRWTLLAIGCLFATIGSGMFIIASPVSAQWQDTLFRFALILPLIGIAAYAARISTHYRLLSRWAKVSFVQIISVGAFAEKIPTPEGRKDLILFAGRTVFGPPVFADESKTGNVSGIPPELLELFKDVVRRETR